MSSLVLSLGEDFLSFEMGLITEMGGDGSGWIDLRLGRGRVSCSDSSTEFSFSVSDSILAGAFLCFLGAGLSSSESDASVPESPRRYWSKRQGLRIWPAASVILATEKGTDMLR